MSKQKNYAAYWIAQIEHRTVPIERCIPHPRNPRQHPPDQISDLRASYRRFGQFRSLVGIENAHTQGNVWIAAGCGTLAAMNEEHAPMVDIGFLPPETPPDIVEGIMVADNNLSNKASDDDALLAQLIQEQKNAGFDLASLGSDDEALRQMLESLGDEVLDEGKEDEIPGINAPDLPYKNQFAVAVMCGTEEEQKTVFDSLVEQGYTCKVLVV